MAHIDRAREMEFEDEPYRNRAPRPSRTVPSRLVFGLGVLTVGIVVGLVGLWAGRFIVNRLDTNPPTNPDAKLREAVANGALDVEEAENHHVFEQAKESVVSVNLVLQRRNGFELAEETTGAGSGFVWDAEGRVVTNYHVVQEAARRPDMAIRVVMSDPSIHYNAAIVGLAAEYDLAVIQLQGFSKIKAIGVGTSNDLVVGQKAFAIGNPFELPGTLTRGIISALNRPTRAPSGGVILGCLQHTAAINPGNSGGPLLNRFGNLIGVNSSIITPSGGNVGIGFAIPVDTVNQVVTELIRNGRTLKPDLGVRLYDQQRLRQAGFDRGVMIAEVKPDGPADRAGLRGIQRLAGRVTPGDLITAINGQAVQGLADYQRYLSQIKPGEKAIITYERDNNSLKTTVSVQGV